MKTIKFFIFCMIAALFVQAQDVPPHTLSEVEVIPPRFTAVKADNWQNVVSVNNYIAKNLNQMAILGYRDEGTEVVKFVVTATGEIADITIINSVSLAVDDEITHVLKSSSHMWMPGQNNGVPVAMEKEIAIQIKIGTTEPNAQGRDFTKVAQDYYAKGAKKLLIQQKPRQALHKFESAMRYRPYDKGVLVMLALCKMELGKTEAAQKDLARLKKLGGVETVVPEPFAQYTNNVKSYNKLIEILAIR
jgi:tetratricopeptide (TPR) repeat protein